MKIALDAMGGDHAPEEIVKGAVLALDKYDKLEKIFLVGIKKFWEKCRSVRMTDWKSSTPRR